MMQTGQSDKHADKIVLFRGTIEMRKMMTRDFTVVDLETTGLNATRDRIIEIGALKIRNGEVADSFSQLVNPERMISSVITEVTGIDDDMVRDADTIQCVLPKFLEFAGDDVLLGHNLQFDYSFLKQNAVNLSFHFERMGVDTLKIARARLKELPSRSLEDLCRYYGIEDKNHHRALNDVTVTWALYRILEERFAQEHPELFVPNPMTFAVKRQSAVTPRQAAYLHALAKKHKLVLEAEPESLSKSEASRLIDHIILQYGK